MSIAISFLKMTSLGHHHGLNPGVEGQGRLPHKVLTMSPTAFRDPHCGERLHKLSSQWHPIVQGVQVQRTHIFHSQKLTRYFLHQSSRQRKLGRLIDLS
uniref:Uncharacterized protein n=1 Tax=Lepeophtheirus salmonis TaxID=72036 RepID=A0A0K2TV90_LEPSM